jgi:hypothetical protein
VILPPPTTAAQTPGLLLRMENLMVTSDPKKPSTEDADETEFAVTIFQPRA